MSRRSIESCVKPIIIAKQVEAGKTKAQAEAMAESNEAAGIAFLRSKINEHSATTGGMQASHDAAMDELRDWAAALA